MGRVEFKRVRSRLILGPWIGRVDGADLDGSGILDCRVFFLKFKSNSNKFSKILKIIKQLLKISKYITINILDQFLSFIFFIFYNSKKLGRIQMKCKTMDYPGHGSSEILPRIGLN
jgi:hypothetical protein